MLLALPCAAGAQDADARLRTLETELEALKKRIDVLEGRAPPAPAAPQASAPARDECPRAGDLRMSMSQAEVRRILGEPSRVEATPLQTTWRYACGSAYFDAETRRFVGFERAR